ncbi:hypothetical protein HY031_02000 [Candidatus Gottesmanbacteria bacterium]|nr:hypothetical protein [Candidatus Gottesmanbacteria bacterium]
MTILGISCYYHESAAALIRDGRTIAASAQERFSRKKHDPGFPDRAVDFCLKSAGIKAQELDYVVFYEKPLRKFERNLLISLEYFPRSASFFVDGMRNMLTEKLWIKSKIASSLRIGEERILFVPHHLSHASASFYPSLFSHAAVLTLDGIGEWTTGMMGRADGNKIYPELELRFPHSVGLLYSTFTAYLGFEVNDGEYKVMGLSGYGRPRYTAKIKKLYRQFRDGAVRLNLKYFAFQRSSERMYSALFEREFKGLSRFDIAASIQKVTEEIILTMMRALYKRTKEENLVFGGGVALNSVVNGLIRKKTPFREVFIFPAAGDDGGAVGAALYAYHHVLGYKKRFPLKDVFLGQQFNNAMVQQFLYEKKSPHKRMSNKRLVDFISEQLLRGKVIGWFEGRAEFGPRALGHRSILADPKDPNMKDIVNKKIKFREEFRPFAPVVLAEKAATYFSNTNTRVSPYMLETTSATSQAKRFAAATVHVDGTSRIQSVAKDYPGNYRRLLEVFFKRTGRPILLNTSFNLKGEPIVNSPADAYKTFERSGIDILVLENFVVEK